MDEDLDLDAECAHLLRDARDLAHRALAREDDPARALRGEEARGLRVGARHLRRGVPRDAARAARRHDAPVGGEDGVDERRGEVERAADGAQLAVEDDRVERKVELSPARATAHRRLAQAGLVEVRRGGGAHVEPAQAEIDGVRAGVERGLQLREPARRGEQLDGAVRRGAFGAFHGVARRYPPARMRR